MRPRTRLTSPDGQEPEALGSRRRGSPELYSNGFAIPAEPGLPARWPWVSAALAAALLIVALFYVLLAVAGVEEQDPSLGEIHSEPVSAGS